MQALCHKRDHRAVFWKVVPSGKGTGRQCRSPADAMTMESRESAWGSHVCLLYAALAALMASFAEPSCSAATAITRNWLCPSHACALPCLASLGPGGQSWGNDGFIVCALPGPGFLYGRRHPSPSLRLQSSLFSLKWGCAYQHEVWPCACLLPTGPHPGGGSGPGALPAPLVRI